MGVQVTGGSPKSQKCAQESVSVSSLNWNVSTINFYKHFKYVLMNLSGFHLNV
jgi:hypothetical protein